MFWGYFHDLFIPNRKRGSLTWMNLLGEDSTKSPEEIHQKEDKEDCLLDQEMSVSLHKFEIHSLVVEEQYKYLQVNPFLCYWLVFWTVKKIVKWNKISITVNQLNFAALKFRGLPLLSLFRPCKFHVLVSQNPFLTKTLFHKNACSSINNGPIFKI